MSPVRGRTKKLIVAFHFHRSPRAGWKCDACRKQGLDRKRRCGYLPVDLRGPVTTVWTGGGVGVTECPKPILSAFSLVALEGFFAAKALRSPVTCEAMDAKSVDAWQVLEQELRKEQPDEQT
jgi:hypothetical protein